MKTKFAFLILFLFSLFVCAEAKECLAPALQLNLPEYKEYFIKPSDFIVKLKTFSDYKISCESDILGINYGDTDNLRFIDNKNDIGEIEDMKSVILKTRYETYTYIRLFKSTKEIVNLMLLVNPLYPDNQNLSLGLCKISPYRGE